MTTATVPTFVHPQRDAITAGSSSPAYQAYQTLHIAFVAIPVIAGLDKFADWLANWDAYLAPAISRMLPFSTHQYMIGVGVVEILAGLIVAAKPRIGALIVAAWMLCVIVNLFIAQDFFDIALRDFGLLLGAVALSRLSIDFEQPREYVRT